MAFVLALLSSVLYGAADFMGCMASRRTHVFSATAASQAVGLVALLVAACFVPGATRAADLLWGVGAGVSGGVGVLLLYRALAIGPVSTAAPLISMIALMVPVLVGVAGGERPGLLPAIGIGAAVIAVVLISGGEGGSSPASDVRRPAVPFGAVLSGLCIGAFLVCLGRIGGGASLWPLVIARATGATAIVVAALAAKHSLAALQPPAAAWPPILGAGAADVVANLLYVVAAQRAPLSLVATIVSLAPATTVLLAQLLLRERLRARQGAGVALALGAIVLLAQAH